MRERSEGSTQDNRAELEQRVNELNAKRELSQRRYVNSVIKLSERDDSEEISEIVKGFVYATENEMHSIWLTSLAESGVIGAANFLRVWDLVDEKVAIKRELYAAIVSAHEADPEG